MNEKSRGPSSKRIKQLIKVAQEMGLKRLRVGEVEFELYPQSQMPKTVDKVESTLETELEREPTEDEMLMMSSPFYDDIREGRAAAIKSP